MKPPTRPLVVARWRRSAVMVRWSKAAKRATTTWPTPDELVYDGVEGLNYYRDFGHLDAVFADPALARDRAHLTRLREYPHDDSVSPLAIHRLVQRYPVGADPVFRALPCKPAYS